MIRVGLPEARVLFSTRHGGVSEGPYESLNLGILTDDDPDRVTENRAILAREAGLDPERIAMGWQVHGVDLREWDSSDCPSQYARPGLRRMAEARAAGVPHVDGHLTSEPGLALLVLVADCLPLALAGGGRVAMVHCGWRGLAGGIVELALDRFSEPPSAAIGPGIGPCCYEVGQEVRDAFTDVDGAVRGRMLDLRAVVRRKLEAAGVREVQDVDLCTSCRGDLFFSHRRDGGITGRQAGLAWIPGA